MVGAEKHILKLLETPTDLWGRYSLEAGRFVISRLLGAFNSCLLQIRCCMIDRLRIFRS